eukprot:scaffold90179_cov20-Tisochrysis_lutea.AAC.2
MVIRIARSDTRDRLFKISKFSRNLLSRSGSGKEQAEIKLPMSSKADGSTSCIRVLLLQAGGLSINHLQPGAVTARRLQSERQPGTSSASK